MSINSIKRLQQLQQTSLADKTIYYKGNIDLLQRPLISIVGSRKPNQYAREMTHILASKLSQAGVCIVSGGAIGTDIIAHKAAGVDNTIMVAATGLDKRYPVINKTVIQAIENKGLVLSQFQEGTPSQKYNFPLRNELIVALGEILIVPYADKNSGTIRSIEYAKKMQKPIFVLPHRLYESLGTNELLAKKEASAIYDIEEFVQSFAPTPLKEEVDEFLTFCQTNPTYEEALKKFASRVFEAELQGDIIIKNGRIYLQN